MKRAVIEKEFEYKGYTCCVILQSMGHRCGYVKIPKDHTYYNVDYMKIPVDCHGGLTYGSNRLYGHDANKDDYWIGWDYAHYGDAKVSFCEMAKAFAGDNETLETILCSYSLDDMFSVWAYSLFDVIEDCESVVDQLIELRVTDGE